MFDSDAEFGCGLLLVFAFIFLVTMFFVFVI